MRIQNYEIEPYEYGYQVSEILVAQKGDNIGTEYKTDTKYPRDLTRALEMVRDNLQRKKIKNTLQETIDTLVALDREFLEELKTIIQ
jgi:hypothetical protein